MRLLKAEQDMLITKVKETVFGDTEKKAYETFKTECQAKVMATLREKYPAKDMAVLSKYGFAVRPKLISIRSNNYDRGDLELPEEILLPPHAYLVDPSMYDQLKLRKDQLEKANTLVREPYFKLIRGSTTWEQVVAVWPEAKKYQPAKGCVALIAVSPEVKVLVQKDSKKREWK
jgi:hypothetical protein